MRVDEAAWEEFDTAEIAKEYDSYNLHNTLLLIVVHNKWNQYPLSPVLNEDYL